MTRCLVFQCRTDADALLYLGTQGIGDVCQEHGHALGFGEVPSLSMGRFDTFVVEAERASGHFLVQSLSHPNNVRIYTRDHYVILSRGQREEGPVHTARFDEATGQIVVEP